MLIQRLPPLQAATGLREKPSRESVAVSAAAKAVISAFADLAIDGGVVPLGALEDYLDRTPRAAVLALLRQVEGDGLIEFTPHPVSYTHLTLPTILRV